MKRIILLFAILFSACILRAQQPAYWKMSGLVRQAARHYLLSARQAGVQGKKQPRASVLTAFVQTNDDGERLLEENGCSVIASFGNIHIVSIPLARLAHLSAEKFVKRIEAGQRCMALMDTTVQVTDALPVYSGLSLPQPYTGKGVVVGVQDIGFDLTHPNFYSGDLSNYRIKTLWDQISLDTIGSDLYVGRDYQGEDELLALGRPRDGDDQTHGTHTAGIAAGSGYNSPYRGMAFESDIALVVNATGNDIDLIAPEDYYKYTYATDALGFKYLFDYAQKQGKPCVINFSEGSMQDMHGYDKLYYAILDSLTGPGRIIVASAGNNGRYYSYLHKPVGKKRDGAFIFNYDTNETFTAKSADPFTINIKAYNGILPCWQISTEQVLAQPDSSLSDTLLIGQGDSIYIDAYAYPSAYNSQETCYDVQMSSRKAMTAYTLAFSVEGEDADVECYRQVGVWYTNEKDTTLTAGDKSHSLASPSSAPCVISVGASGYRTSWTNYQGRHLVYEDGSDGLLSGYSSVGPTFDERMKPDVVAPGTNIISSYSSYYLEHHPDNNDIYSDVEHFVFNDRTYAWNCNSGTSMASPVVAGAIALWLQACPTLTPADCKDIISRIATHPDTTLSYPNNSYGYGQIDVYAGLKEAISLQEAGIRNLSGSLLRCSKASDRVVVHFPSATTAPVSVQVYNLSGTMVRMQTLAAGTAEAIVDMSAMPRGVYAFHFVSKEKDFRGTIVLKL